MILDQIQKNFGGAVISSHDFRGDETVVIKREALLDVMRELKTCPEFDFNILMDLTAVDYLTYPSPPPSPQRGEGEKNSSPLPLRGRGKGEGEEKGPRFEVVYHLYSLKKGQRIRVKVPVEEKDPSLPSLTAIWPAADWYEREVWDMFGIRFSAHPNLKRIMMYEEFSGHPLRKDYPVNKRQPLIGPKN